MNLLIIEDDHIIRSLIEKNFQDLGYDVYTARTAEAGFDIILQLHPEAIILDIMLPGMDGLSLLKKLRNLNNNTPVLLLSAKHSVEERVNGLQAGADDYLVKPFATPELIARIQALIKRSKSVEEVSHLKFDELSIDINKRVAARSGSPLSLQTKEYALLDLFLRNPEKVLTKSMILEQVWGYDFDPQTNVVDVLVCRLRNKVDKDHETKYIHTHRGVGYVLKKN
jgi:two-component system OmpR family response regulator